MGRERIKAIQAEVVIGAKVIRQERAAPCEQGSLRKSLFPEMNGRLGVRRLRNLQQRACKVF